MPAHALFRRRAGGDRMRILIVDDNEINRKLLRVTLATAGHEVVEAADGVEAFERLRSCRFEAVITDILMPRMDGYQLCYKIRRDETFKDLPIVVYSATYTSASDGQLALKVGADRFLRKPAAHAEILRSLQEAIRAPRPRGEAVAPGTDLETLKQYSEGLVRNLERTNSELEAAQQRLTAANDSLRESERAFREIVEYAPAGIARSTPEGKILAANAAFAGILGYGSAQELLGMDANRDVYFDPAERAAVVEHWARLGPAAPLEFRMKKSDGTAIWVEGHGRAVRDSSGKILSYEAFVQDVDQRKKVEESLERSEERIRVSEEKYRLLFESNPLPMWVFDNETLAFLAVNPAACRHYGYSHDEFLSMTVKDSRSPEDASLHLRDIEMGGSGFQTSGTWRHRKKDGTLIHVEVTSAPFVFDGRAAELVLAIDVTDRLRAEEGMRKSEERFRKLFESNTIGIAVADLSGHLLECNDAYLAILGFDREDLVSGKVGWSDLTPEEHRARDQIAVEELQRTGIASPWEKEFVRKDGTRVPVLIGIAMLKASEGSCIAYLVDLSERRRLEEQFRQAQKMEAVGQLAGGVAHDFNNLLTAILGYSDLLASRLKPGSVEIEELDEIRKAGERAASLTRQLLAFSRQQVLERKVLDLNSLIADVGKMLHRLIGEDIALVTVLDPGLRRVWADAGQLEQVVMNLAVNARDAMPRGGKLTIETANVELDEAYARKHVTVRPGSFVMLAVSDSGTGMDLETLSKIFEPFFTTKETGKGTGLGLSTVYGIVKQSGGHVWVYSEPGKGTTFKIYLPPSAEGLSPEHVPLVGTLSLRGSETVLLVEDEQSVRALTRVILENHGYTVLEAASGEKALKIVRDFDGPIHLVLTDVVMPSMGGSTLVSHVETLRPGIKVLYMSGYTDDAVVRHGHLDQGRAFLQKPFTPEGLARKVREALRS